jgi:hypothetical protein
VNGLSIFCSIAGSSAAPNFASHSRIPVIVSDVRLFTLLSGAAHPVAPDDPGFDRCDALDPTAFEVRFDDLARITERFTELIGIYQ